MTVIKSLLLLALGITQYCAADTTAQLLWHENDAFSHAIFISNLENKKWTAARQIHTSNFPMSSVALSKEHEGEQLLIWSEQLDNKSVLMHKWFDVDLQSYSPPKILSDHGAENVGTSLVSEPNGKIWVFWGSNDSGLSDIVGMSYSNSKWSTVFRLHEQNEVPDILPSAKLDSRGNIVVTWTNYDLELGQYVERSQTINIDATESGRINQNGPDAIEFDAVSLPNFLPNNAVSFIHFPPNMMLQSATISPGSKSKNK